MRQRWYVWSALLLLAVTGQPPVSAALTKAPSYCASSVVQGPNGQPVAPKSPARACRYDVGAEAQGPTLAVSRAGVLFADLGGTAVSRSTDHGQSWIPVPVPPLANGDAGLSHGYLHVDTRTDRLYHVASTQVASCAIGPAPSLAGAVVSWSDDLGRTWHGKTVTCDTYDWGRVLTGPAPKGNPYPTAVYLLGVGKRLVGGERPVYRSLDGGSTWRLMTNLASATTEAGAGVSAPDGTIYFDYPEFNGFDPTRVANQNVPYAPENTCKSMIAVSEDYGTTWRQQAIPRSLACKALTGGQRVAVDRAGTVYALWTDDVTGRVQLVRSRDKARTWSAPVDVTPPGTTYNNNIANIIAGAPGQVQIASKNTTDALNGHATFVAGVGSWHTWLSRSSNANSASPRFESVDLDPADDPSLKNGEEDSEVELYQAINPAGETWTIFTRHKPFGAAQGVGRVWTAQFGARKAAVTPLRGAVPGSSAAAPTVPEGLPATGVPPVIPALAVVALLACAVVRRPRVETEPLRLRGSRRTP